MPARMVSSATIGIHGAGDSPGHHADGRRERLPSGSVWIKDSIAVRPESGVHGNREPAVGPDRHRRAIDGHAGPQAPSALEDADVEAVSEANGVLAERRRLRVDRHGPKARHLAPLGGPPAARRGTSSPSSRSSVSTRTCHPPPGPSRRSPATDRQHLCVPGGPPPAGREGAAGQHHRLAGPGSTRTGPCGSGSSRPPSPRRQAARASATTIARRTQRPSRPRELSALARCVRPAATPRETGSASPMRRADDRTARSG